MADFSELTDEQRGVLGDVQALRYDDLLIELEEIENEQGYLDDRKYEVERNLGGIVQAGAPPTT